MLAETDMSTAQVPAQRYVHPSFFMAKVVNPMVTALGAPALTVRGRRTGRSITVPLASFLYEGKRYLVGGRGQAQWTRNLRAAGAARLRVGRRSFGFTAVELSGAERQRVLDAYRGAYGRRAAAFFTALPDPADHPVFRVEPDESQA